MPKICVVLRKAYGAGLYAMCGPGFEPDATLALPQASIAVMGPEAAVNAVYYNKIQEKPEAERAAYVESAARAVPRRTSISTSWPPTCTSTRSSPATSCATSSCAGSTPARHKRTHPVAAQARGAARLTAFRSPAMVKLLLTR